MAYYSEPFEYSGNGMKIQIPAGALFNNMPFRCKVTAANNSNEISPIYTIQDENTPLSANYTLKLKPNPGVSDTLLKKAVVVRLDDNKKESPVGGHFDSGYMTIHPKVFGKYVIMVDRIPPEIKPVNIFKGKNMSRDSIMAFEVTDNLSGLGSFRGTVDGKWILMEYNPKNNLIYYTFDEHVSKGHHHLRLLVNDEVGNSRVYETEFTR
jgi:hypothetical protein